MEVGYILDLLVRL